MGPGDGALAGCWRPCVPVEGQDTDWSGVGTLCAARWRAKLPDTLWPYGGVARLVCVGSGGEVSLLAYGLKRSSSFEL